MSERRVVTKAIATRYVRSDRAVKKVILDELCPTTRWHRDHARKALRRGLVLRPVTSSRKPRHRDRLDRDSVGEEQGPEVGVRRDPGRHRVLPVPDQRDRQRHSY